ncbi:ATP-binding protein [Salinibacter altiplanensis]|uniref:ATP-binding protein n=1 Tax=Salinibacter altiplanensis TaxID=1803181 RepID=UPI000C9F22FC|nr:DUF87 domain-containing protein [Salinibacter altiplanensis]
MSDPKITVGTDTSGEPTRLPIVDILTGRAFITGKSGSGKSNSASVVIEELLSEGHAVLIVDADGEYRGLKEQYEVLHVGAGEACDLQVGPEHSGRLAEIALTQNVPVVLDVSEYLDDEEARTLVQRTTDALYKKEADQRRPFLLVVEEVHEYLPEGPALDDVGQTLIRVAKRGRKRGLGLMGISQRPADVKKSFITQCDWLVWHRLTWDNDTKVVRRVVGSEAASAVQDLGDGESIVLSDWLEESPALVQWRRKDTVDLGATPGLGETEDVELKGISSDIVSELEEISREEERRQDRIASLEEELEEAHERISELEGELERAQDMSDMAKQLAEGLSQTGPEKGSEAVSERLERLQDKVQEERAGRREAESDLAEAQARIEDLEEKAAQVEEARRLEEHMDDVAEAARRLADIAGIELGGDERLRQRVETLQDEKRRLEEELQGTEDEPLLGMKDFLEHQDVQRAIDRAKEAESETQVRRILTALVEDDGGPVTIEQICRREGIKPTGGNLSRIRSAADHLAKWAIVAVEGSGKGTEITLRRDLQAVQDEVGRAESREELKDVI